MNLPKLIVVSGPPGAGKSTLCQSLGEQLPAVILDKDCVDDAFWPADRGEHYTNEVEPKCLQALLNIAARNLNAGHHILLDAPWTHIVIDTPLWIEKLEQLAQTTAAQLVVLECVLPEDQVRIRMQQRGLARDDFRIGNDDAWNAFVVRDKLEQRIPLPHHTIDMMHSKASCVDRALAVLT